MRREEETALIEADRKMSPREFVAVVLVVLFIVVVLIGILYAAGPRSRDPHDWLGYEPHIGRDPDYGGGA